jgi:hypothetical protein
MGILGRQGFWAGNESAYQNTWFDTAKTLRIRSRLFYDLPPPSKQPFDTPASHKPTLRSIRVLG